MACVVVAYCRMYGTCIRSMKTIVMYLPVHSQDLATEELGINFGSCNTFRSLRETIGNRRSVQTCSPVEYDGLLSPTLAR